MNSTESDPHVNALYYVLQVGEGIRFDAPLPVIWDTELATLELCDGRLKCTMKQHFAEPRMARNAVEWLLKSWEVSAALDIRLGAIKFRFTNADVVDRRPIAPEEIRGTAVFVEGIDSCEAFGTPTVITTHREYPPPRPHFCVHPDVATLWQRLQGHLEGREPLLAMAYFCLTVIEVPCGGRKGAAARWNVEFGVLKKLGELVSERGDGFTARKADLRLKPLTVKEGRWILAAVKELIYVIGDTRYPNTRPRLCMSALPPL